MDQWMDHITFCSCNTGRDGGKAVLVMCQTGILETFRTLKTCSTCREAVGHYRTCHWCKECDEMMCEACFADVVKNPGHRILSMQNRLEADPKHWLHKVKADREPSSQHLMSWNNNADRRCKTFNELEENQTPLGTYAYDHNKNRYTAQDKKAYATKSRQVRWWWLQTGQRQQKAPSLSLQLTIPKTLFSGSDGQTLQPFH